MTNNSNAPVTQATSNKTINVMIDKVRKSGALFNEQVQTAIEAIIVHGQTYGDVTAAGRLVGAMPNTTRRAEVVKHFADYSPIRVTVNAKESSATVKSFKASLFKDDDKVMTERMERLGNTLWDVDGCRANPWFDRAALQREPDFDRLFVNFYDDAIKFAERLERSVTDKVKVTGPDGVERVFNKVEEHEQHRVRFLAKAIREAAMKSKTAPIDETTDENTDESTNQHDEPMSRTGTEG